MLHGNFYLNHFGFFTQSLLIVSVLYVCLEWIHCTCGQSWFSSLSS